MDMGIKPASGGNQAFTGNGFGAGADNNVDIGLNIRITGFADGVNAAVFKSDIGFNDAPVIQNKGIGDDRVDGVLATALGLPHAVSDNFAAAEFDFIALADRHALELARLRCDEALSRLTGEGSMTAWISLMLEEADDHQPRQHELARMLNLSTRTMNRRLAAEGQSFRELGIQARQQRACRLLAGTRMAITRIAYQLGYRDAANFSRAFRRHHGMSPLDYRKRMTGPARPGHRD